MPALSISELQAVLASPGSVAEILQSALNQMGPALRVDRCFLYVRDPAQGKGRIALVWCLDEAIPDPRHDWQLDTGELPQQDPLFRAALAGQPSVFVDDVREAGPEILNQEFERQTFGHRALVHGHILDEQKQLWGILQPCVFSHPRHWTPTERTYLESALPLLLPLVQRYMQEQID